MGPAANGAASRRRVGGREFSLRLPGLAADRRGVTARGTPGEWFSRRVSGRVVGRLVFDRGESGEGVLAQAVVVIPFDRVNVAASRTKWAAFVATSPCTRTRRTSSRWCRCCARCGHRRDRLLRSTAVCGTPVIDLVTEGTPTAPGSPHGLENLVGERLIQAEALAGDLQHTSLRYFNVAGLGRPGAARHPCGVLSRHGRPVTDYGFIRLGRRP